MKNFNLLQRKKQKLLKSSFKNCAVPIDKNNTLCIVIYTYSFGHRRSKRFRSRWHQTLQSSVLKVFNLYIELWVGKSNQPPKIVGDNTDADNKTMLSKLKYRYSFFFENYINLTDIILNLFLDETRKQESYLYFEFAVINNLKNNWYFVVNPYIIKYHYQCHIKLIFKKHINTLEPNWKRIFV